MAAAMAAVAGGAAAGADILVRAAERSGRRGSIREAIAQIATIGEDALDERALPLVPDQGVDQVDLVHGDELEDFAADLAARPAAAALR